MKKSKGNAIDNNNRNHNNKPRNRPPQKRESTSSPNQSTQKMSNVTKQHIADTNWNNSKMGKKNNKKKKNEPFKEGRGGSGMLFDPNSGSMVAASSSSMKQSGKQIDMTSDKKKDKPPPRPRTVCLAEEHLIQTIEQTKTQTASIHGEESMKELLDIPKDEIKDLPEVPYKQTKKIVLVTNATASNVAVALIRKELTTQSFDKDSGTTTSSTSTFQYLGFDTETRPKFNKGGNNHPPALLQLATSTTAYLFRLKHEGMHPTNCPMSEALHALLVDTSIIKVGVGIHEDITELQRTYGQSTCGNGTSYLDLGPLAKIRHPQIKRAGLRNLTATLLNWKLSKAQQMKNWEMKTLTIAMEAYAASDALVALDLLAAIIG